MQWFRFLVAPIRVRFFPDDQILEAHKILIMAQSTEQYNTDMRCQADTLAATSIVSRELFRRNLTPLI